MASSRFALLVPLALLWISLASSADYGSDTYTNPAQQRFFLKGIFDKFDIFGLKGGNKGSPYPHPPPYGGYPVPYGCPPYGGQPHAPAYYPPPYPGSYPPPHQTGYPVYPPPIKGGANKGYSGTYKPSPPGYIQPIADYPHSKPHRSPITTRPHPVYGS